MKNYHFLRCHILHFYKHELHDANCLEQEGQNLTTTTTKSLRLKYLLKIKERILYYIILQDIDSLK